jgi:hypothetical protein
MVAQGRRSVSGAGRGASVSLTEDPTESSAGSRILEALQLEQLQRFANLTPAGCPILRAFAKGG